MDRNNRQACGSLLIFTGICLAAGLPAAKAIENAAYLQPPAAAAEPQPEPVAVDSEAPLAEPAAPPRGRLASLFLPTPQSRPNERLAATPKMFGDFFGLGGDIFALDFPDGASANLPLAGGSRRVKVAENNYALPDDRVHLMYNHFHNALDVEVVGFDPAERSLSVDRFTLGLEKTLLDRQWSVEVRMPLTNEQGFANPTFAMAGGSIGNLAVMIKRLLYESDEAAICAGLAIDTPTGSDVQADFLGNLITVHNEAVHLSPYLGILGTPGDLWFYHGFLQIDVPCNGNRVDYVATFPFGSGTFGRINEQTLLYADVGAGVWLLRNPDRRWFTGLASVAELHYTTALQDADVIFTVNPFGDFGFGQFANRVDMLNLTLGLHAEITPNTLFRVGCALPLTTGDNQNFDSELLVQLERRF